MLIKKELNSIAKRELVHPRTATCIMNFLYKITTIRKIIPKNMAIVLQFFSFY